MRQREFHRHTALCAADIHEGAVLFPGKFLGDDSGGAEAETGHRLEEPFQPLRVRIERPEKVFACLGLVLRLSGAQPFRQRAPEAIETGVGHFQDAADIGGFVAVQKQRRFRGIGIARPGSPEHAQGHERIKEVSRASRVQSQLQPQRLGIAWSKRQDGEESQAQWRSAASSNPKSDAQLHDLRRREGSLYHSHVLSSAKTTDRLRMPPDGVNGVEDEGEIPGKIE